jgi:hypothetical protein
MSNMQPDRAKNPRRGDSPREGYDPYYLAQKFGITPAQARDVIMTIGTDRTKLNDAARRLKRPPAKIRPV